MEWIYEQRGDWEFRHRFSEKTDRWLAECTKGRFIERDAINCLDEPSKHVWFAFAETPEAALAKVAAETQH